MQIFIDPTHAEFTTLEAEGRTLKFLHFKRDCGAVLIQKLAQLEISEKDELAIVLGPGNFTATRTACLIGNAIHFLKKCQLSARHKDDLKFKKVESFQPFYATAPSITVPKK